MYKKTKSSSSSSSKPFKPPLISNKPKHKNDADLLFRYKQLSHARNDKLANLDELIEKWRCISQTTSVQLFQLLNYADDLIFQDFLHTLSIDAERLGYSKEQDEFV
ncbi:hypothetical protein E3P99_02365 [Wallemia hederae]|uniref:Swi5-dependent recombination DNA repair protein 1 homolog n=1 Tax=Wallemia hederae TaxID=1540922 RepID=A0A4T0FKN1_9BASI|nr:hypothetical protein E3P99_02365 [Wallemia hederae]